MTTGPIPPFHTFPIEKALLWYRPSYLRCCLRCYTLFIAPLSEVFRVCTMQTRKDVFGLEKRALTFTLIYCLLVLYIGLKL
jgi:hypothetical protein